MVGLRPVESHPFASESVAGQWLARAGFDLVAPLRAADYDAVVPASQRVCGPGGPSPLAVLVGHSRAVWAPFIAWLAAEPLRLSRAHPLDDYTAAQVAVAVALTGVPAEVRYDWQAVDVLRAAEVAGLLSRGASGLGVHPVHGPWVALRAVVVFDQPASVTRALAAPQCAHCPTACGPRARALGPPTDLEGVRSNWRDWVALREACPLGAHARYTDEQIRYHYTGDRGVLHAAVAREKVTASS